MEAAKQMFSKENCLPTLAPCMVVFAVPLLVPGLTLTFVPLRDETGFSKYSALHILGMVLLACAVLLLLVGLWLNIVVCKKAKSRVSPQEEDSISRSSSHGSDMTGYVHSTHTIKLTQSPSTNTVKKKTPTSLADPPDHGSASPDSRGAGGDRLPSSSTSSQPSTSSAERSPLKSQMAVLAEVASASTTLQEGFRAETMRRTGSLAEAGDEDLSAEASGCENPSIQYRGGCNYMLSDSEDEEAQAAQYALAAEELRKYNNDKTVAISTSSSESSEHSSRETSEAEYDAESLELDQRTVLSDQRKVSVSKTSSSYSSPNHSAFSSSPLAEDCSKGKTGDIQMLYSDDNEGTNLNAEYCFVTSERTPNQSLQIHTNLTKTGYIQGSKNPDQQQTCTLQEISSSSMFTESPSHGTYSVKSFASSEEHLGLKETPEESSTDEEDVFHSSLSFPAEYNPETSRSVSPVPLKADMSGPWKELADHSITVLGSRSGGSSQSSFGKHPRTGSLHTDTKSDHGSKPAAETDRGRKKKKRRKHKRRREESSTAEASHTDPVDAEEGVYAIVEHTGRPVYPPKSITETLAEDGARHVHLSPLRSIMYPHHQQAHHHVHWTDEDLT